VNWTNKDSVTHSVTSFNGAFDSGDLPAAKNFYLTLQQPGVFDYYCKHHKETGTVTVQ
jgi:plastocyanin